MSRYVSIVCTNHILVETIYCFEIVNHTEKIKAMKGKTEKEKNCVSNIDVKVTDGGEI